MWKKINQEHPPINKWIKTKIEDEHGIRNEQYLKFDGKLWWADDDMYVYYTPTHWKS